MAPAGGVTARGKSLARGLDAGEANLGVVQEAREDAHCVGSAAHASDDLVGEATEFVEALTAGLATDDGLEGLDHLRIGRGAGDRADDVEGVLGGSGPVADGLVHGVFERARARLDGDNLRAEGTHTVDVRGLARDVQRAHVDDAGESKEGGCGGGGDAVHARAGLGNQARLAHTAGEEGLAKDVVDLVGAGVVEVLALEEDTGAAEGVGKSAGLVKRGLAANVVAQERLIFGLEVRVGVSGTYCPPYCPMWVIVLPFE